MPLLDRKFAAWLLIALFATASGLGEGFHFVPGCGHYIALPRGYFGLGVAGFPVSWADRTGAEVAPARDKTILILDEDECAICSFAGHAKQWSTALNFAPVFDVVDETPLPDYCEPIISIVWTRHVRAPPLA